MEVTLEQLLEDLRKVEDQDTSDAMTREEWQDLVGWGEKKTIKVLKRLVKAGKVRYRPVKRETITGVVSPRPGYEIIK